MAGKAHLGTVILSMAVITVLFVLYFRSGPEPVREQPATPSQTDPRLSFPSAYRNTRPEVAYVADEVCADCHGDKAETFHQHPMGRSLAPVASVAAQQRYDDAVHNPFDSAGATFR